MDEIRKTIKNSEIKLTLLKESEMRLYNYINEKITEEIWKLRKYGYCIIRRRRFRFEIIIDRD
jgi:hypothetical protein